MRIHWTSGVWRASMCCSSLCWAYVAFSQCHLWLLGVYCADRTIVMRRRISSSYSNRIAPLSRRWDEWTATVIPAAARVATLRNHWDEHVRPNHCRRLRASPAPVRLHQRHHQPHRQHHWIWLRRRHQLQPCRRCRYTWMRHTRHHRKKRQNKRFYNLAVYDDIPYIYLSRLQNLINHMVIYILYCIISYYIYICILC